MWLCGFHICTKGVPLPCTQKTMVTLSVVLAYWMRGSMAALSYTIRTTRGSDAMEKQTPRPALDALTAG